MTPLNSKSSETLFNCLLTKLKKHKANLELIDKFKSKRVWLISFLLFFSQILELITFFLPLKIIIVLGSKSVPHFISHYLNIYNIDSLLKLLISLIFILYLMSMAFSLTALKLSSIDVGKLIAVHKEEHGILKDTKIKRHYEQYTRYNSDLLVVYICLILILLLTPILSFGILILVSLEFMTLQILTMINNQRFKYFYNLVQVYVKEFTQYIVAVNFFLVLLILATQYMFGIPVNVLPTILAFFLARKMFNSARNIILYLSRVN